MDASDVGVGAMLEQEQEDGGCVVRSVIAYASKTLSDLQQRYCTVEFRSLLWFTSLYVALRWTRGFSLKSATPRTSERAFPRL